MSNLSLDNMMSGYSDIIINDVKYKINNNITKNSYYFNTLINDSEYEEIIEIKTSSLPSNKQVWDDFFIMIDNNTVDFSHEHFYDFYKISHYIGYEYFLKQLKQPILTKLFYYDLNPQVALAMYENHNLSEYLKNPNILINDEYVNVIDYSKKKLCLNKYLDFFEIWKYNVDENINFYDKMLFDVFEYTDFTKCIVKNINVFKQKLEEMSFGLLDINYDNVVIAGGATLACLLNRKMKISDSSDIDIWIYGQIDDRKKTFIRLLKHFDNYNAYYSVKSNVITVIVKNVKRNYQIIYTDYVHKYEIIKNFDMSYVKCLYDGNNVYGTNTFIKTMEEQLSDYKENITQERLTKAFIKGFLSSDYNLVELKQKYYYPDNESENIVLNIKDIFKNKNVFEKVDDVIDGFNFNSQWNMNNYINVNTLNVRQIEEVCNEIELDEYIREYDKDEFDENEISKNEMSKYKFYEDEISEYKFYEDEISEYKFYEDEISEDKEWKSKNMKIKNKYFAFKIDNILLPLMYYHDRSKNIRYAYITGCTTLKGNMNIVEPNILYFSEYIIKKFNATRKIYEHRNILEHLKYRVNKNCVASNIEDEMKYYIHKEDFLNIDIKISEKTVIVDINNVEQTKIRRMSYCNMNLMFQIDGNDYENSISLHSTKIVVLPNNYIHNAKNYTLNKKI